MKKKNLLFTGIAIFGLASIVNGQTWAPLGSLSGQVQALAVSGTDIYAGGGFNVSGSVSIGKWDGSSWTGLSTGTDNTVLALAVSGTDLYAGGLFTTAGGSPANYIAKWDGTSWSALGSGLNGPVNALVVSGTDLYVGGTFTSAGGSPANYIAKWDGTSWMALGSLSGQVQALAVSGTDLYAGGGFNVSGSVSIGKWDGSSWTGLSTGTDNNVLALAVSGTDLYAGGLFTTAGGSPANYIAKWDIPVGINEVSQSNLFSVYPNPANSHINVKADAILLGSDYTVYDNTGKLVLTGKINSENTVIELGYLSGGIYLFSVGETLKQTFKVIKE